MDRETRMATATAMTDLKKIKTATIATRILHPIATVTVTATAAILPLHSHHHRRRHHPTTMMTRHPPHRNMDHWPSNNSHITTMEGAGSKSVFHGFKYANEGSRQNHLGI